MMSEPRSSGARRWLWPTTAVAILALLVGSVAYALIGGRRAEQRSLGEAALQRSLDDIAKGDDVVLDVDAALRAPVIEGDDVLATRLTARLGGGRRPLERAAEEASEAARQLEGSHREAARQAGIAADGRLAMLAAAEPLLGVRSETARALEPADAAWSYVTRATNLSAEASRRYNQHTKAGVSASSQLSAQAASALASATVELKAAGKVMPDADLQPYLAYVRMRADLVKRSRTIDDLWLSGEVAQANAQLDAYNAADRKAVAAAEKLRGTPGAAISRAYDARTKADWARYVKARERARAADERIAKLRTQ